MKLRDLAIIAAVLFSSLGSIRAADLAGKWTAEFDTQVGVQKYVYEFKATADKFTGKATFERSTGNGEAELKDVKLTGENISFTEPLSIEGNEITITYSGKIAGDEIKLTRTVGDFAAEQIVARRAKASEGKPAPAK